MQLDNLIEVGKDICTIVGAVTISSGILYLGFKSIVNTFERIVNYTELKELERDGYHLEKKPTILNANWLANRTYRM